VNGERWEARAEILWEKGTNRTQFFRGAVDKYTWVDIGSSYLPSEITAAFLCAQLEAAREITERRQHVWRRYHEAFAPLESEGLIRRPMVPTGCAHNAHLYYLLFADLSRRTAAQDALRKAGLDAVFHYVPLHSSPAGRRFGRAFGSLPVTDAVSARLLRLPMWAGLPDDQISKAVQAIAGALESAHAG